jgi:hypothetical protein
MPKDAIQRDLFAPDEICARHHCLHEEVEAPDLIIIKFFFSLLYRYEYELQQNRGETYNRFG